MTSFGSRWAVELLLLKDRRGRWVGHSRGSEDWTQQKASTPGLKTKTVQESTKAKDTGVLPVSFPPSHRGKRFRIAQTRSKAFQQCFCLMHKFRAVNNSFYFSSWFKRFWQKHLEHTTLMMTLSGNKTPAASRNKILTESSFKHKWNGTAI